MNKKYKLAVFISHIYGDFQHKLCQGIIDSAKKLGYSVDFFHSNDEMISREYCAGESSIFRFFSNDFYDGILVSSGTYLVKELEEALYTHLSTTKLPIIDINPSNTRFPSINLDNSSVFADMIEHLIQVHEKKHIYYLGNQMETQVSHARRVIYEQSLLDFNLNPSNYPCFQASYDKSSIHAAVEAIMNQVDSPADAILCYNDSMAFIAMEHLQQLGFSIPEQIAVCACDNLDFGQHIEPALSTITFPSFELGETAVDLLVQQIEQGVTIPAKSYVKAKPIYRNSCGCSYSDTISNINFSNHLKEKTDRLEAEILEQINIGTLLLHATDLELAMDSLTTYILEKQKFKHFHLFLYSNWDYIQSSNPFQQEDEDDYDTNNYQLKLGIQNSNRLPEHSFTSLSAVSQFLSVRDVAVRIFSPLYFCEKEFGFVSFAYENNEIYYPFNFVNFLRNINCMLNNISEYKHMQTMENRLFDIYYRDELSGFFNKQGFLSYAKLMLEEGKAKQIPLSLLALEFSNFKEISKSFGLEEGQFSIQVFAKAIERSAREQVAITRYHGEQFFLLLATPMETTIKTTLENIQNYLDHYVKLQNKPYSIQCNHSFLALSDYTQETLLSSMDQAHQNLL